MGNVTLRTPATVTRIPVALVGLGLAFRIGTFLLWPVMFLGILALCGFVVWGAIESGRYFFLLYIIPIPLVVGYICFQAAGLTLKGTGSSELAMAASKADYPALWDMAEQCADIVGAAPPDNILIGMSANFYVTESPVSLQGQWRSPVVEGRSLYVSAPLLRLMNLDETKAVLAHEFAHFTGRDTVYSTQIAPVYASLTSGIHAIKSEIDWSIKGIVLILPMVITLAYHGMFRILDNAISRRRELRCDEIASEVIGRVHISDGLLKVVGYGTLLSEYIDGQFVSLMREKRTFQNYPEWFSYFAREESARSVVSRILSYAAAARTHATDSHPALGTRLKALNVSSLLRSPDIESHYPLPVEFGLEGLEVELTRTYARQIQNYIESGLLAIDSSGE